MPDHLLAPIVGLFGDTLTFAGGTILAWDAVQQDKQFRKIRRLAETLAAPELVHLRVEVEGVVIADERDIEHAFIRHSARRALIGAITLAFGFGFLFATRWLEIFFP